MREHKPAVLRELTADEVRQKVREMNEELFNLRFQHATGQLDNTHKLNVTRREIARLLTTIRQRELDKTAAGGEG